MVVIIFKGSEIFPFDDDANQVSRSLKKGV
jgi:hypothetical protein